LLPHPYPLLLGGLFPTRGQPGLILSFLDASPIARSLCKRIMTGGFLFVIGGDVA